MTVYSLETAFEQMSIDILLLPHTQQLGALRAELGQATQQFAKLDTLIMQELNQLDVSSELSPGVIHAFFNGHPSIIPPTLQVQVT